MKRHVVVAAAGVACVSALALAQSAKPLSNLTVSLTPDAGVVATIPDAVRVVGPTNGNVFISGTVDLSSATLGALGTTNCTYGEWNRFAVTTTPSLMPPNLNDGGVGYLSRRTAATIVNIGSVSNIACRPDPGDGGVPNCTVPGVGATLLTNGGSVRIVLNDDATPIYCVACRSAGSTAEVLEESCTVP